MPRFHSTSLKGPVPIAASPPLKSSVVASGSMPSEMIDSSVVRVIRSGAGPLVCIRIVWGSSISISRTTLPVSAASPSLPSTVPSRSQVNTTSFASKSVPSWNFTPSRSLIRQVSSSTTSWPVASAGCGCSCGSGWNSGS